MSIRRIAMNISAVNFDKFLHLIVGLVISLILGLVNPWYGFAAAVIAGVTKEIFDRFSTGHEEFVDFWWTALGGFLPIIAWQAGWL
jgi:hypothetical protein